MNDPIATLLRASQHQFIGNLGRDPETRFLDSGKSVTNVNIGIADLADRDHTHWIKLEIWGVQGQAFADRCRKGAQVHVIGRVKTVRWTDRSTGEEKMQVCCRVEQWKLMPAAGAPAPAAPAAPAPAQQPAHLAAAVWAPNPANGTVAAPQVWNSPQQTQVPDHDGIPF
jgi:single-strand DNA-binding protein